MAWKARKQLIQLLITMFVLLMSLVVTAQQSSEAERRKPVEIGPGYFALPLHHAVSLPLRDLPAPLPFVETQARERPFHPVNVPRAPGLPQPDTAIQTVAGPLLSATPTLNFEGLGYAQYNFTPPTVPPDTNGAVGATQYVQWVNLSYIVFNKSTGAKLAEAVGNKLWTGFEGPCETNNDGDPIVQYDKLANRWIMTQFSVSTAPPYLQCIAVSQTSDATGKYDLYSYSKVDLTNSNHSPALNDYPKLGVWPDAYYITYMMFSSTGAEIGPQVCAYDRNAMLNSLPLAGELCMPLTQAQEPSVVIPGDLDGTRLPPSGSRDYLLAQGANALDFLSVHVDWSTHSIMLSLPQPISVNTFAPLCPGTSCVPQPPHGNPPVSSNALASLGDRLMYRLGYRNLGDHQSLVISHSVSANMTTPGTPPGGVRWYELRNPNGTTPPTVFQQGTFSPDSTTRWMSSMGMDKVGDVLLGYSLSDGAIDPSIAVTGRVPTDTSGMMETETRIVTGAHPQTTTSRWGDYSAMTIDPADDCTFWYTQEYFTRTVVLSPPAAPWNTRIANLSFPGCTSTLDFSLSLSPPAQAIGTGSQATYTVTVSALDGFAGAVTLVSPNLPTGATATFNPASVTGSGTSTLTITTSSTTTPNGPYTITVTGTNGSLVHSTQSALSVNLPYIMSLSPTSGIVGTIVTINGNNFGATKGYASVQFNGVTASPTSWSPTQIKAPVPSGATTGMVRLLNVGSTFQNSNLVLFTVLPHITSLSTNIGAYGDSIYINGTTFGSSQGTVKFNGIVATILNWTSTQILAKVPAGATTGNVVVVSNGHTSNGVAFTGVPGIVQTCTGDAFTDPSFTTARCTLTNVKPNDLIIVMSTSCAITNQPPTIPGQCHNVTVSQTLTDTLGLAFTTAQTNDWTGSTDQTLIDVMSYAFTGTLSGNETITIQFSGPADLGGFFAAEYTNIPATGGFEGSAQSHGFAAAGTVISVGPVATTASNDIMIMQGDGYSCGGSTLNPGFRNRTGYFITHSDAGFSDGITGSPGNYSGGATINNSSCPWALNFIVFKHIP